MVSARDLARRRRLYKRSHRATMALLRLRMIEAQHASAHDSQLPWDPDYPQSQGAEVELTEEEKQDLQNLGEIERELHQMKWGKRGNDD